MPYPVLERLEHNPDKATPAIRRARPCAASTPSVVNIANQRHRQALTTPDGRRATAKLQAHLLRSTSIAALTKRAYKAHKDRKPEFALELSAQALSAIRAKSNTAEKEYLDQKILLLTVRANALLELKHCDESKACLAAAIKCMAISVSQAPVSS